MALSASAEALLGLVGWTVLLVLLLISQRGLLVLGGRVQVNAFAPDGSTLPGFGQRVARAHANCVENVPLFLAVLLYAMVTGQTLITDPLAPALLLARIVQSLLHLLSTAPLFVWLRFAAYLVQLVILVYWLLRLAGWL